MPHALCFNWTDVVHHNLNHIQYLYLYFNFYFSIKISCEQQNKYDWLCCEYALHCPLRLPTLSVVTELTRTVQSYTTLLVLYINQNYNTEMNSNYFLFLFLWTYIKSSYKKTYLTQSPPPAHTYTYTCTCPCTCTDKKIIR